MTLEGCTCGTSLGACRHADGAVLITWRDAEGNFHINGTGVVIEEMSSGKHPLTDDDDFDEEWGDDT